MGSLHLGRIVRIDLPDDVLAHVHAVIIAKLRVHEPVLVGWTEPDGRHDEVLVNPSMPVVIRYDVDEERTLDRRWLNRLMISANAVQGLQLRPDVVEALRAIEGEAAGAAPASPSAG
ncbi:hypothetical protein ACFPER_17825 [Agromyces aurantiacus]|uniref:DUF7882 domain-containing protein n=1 Tax=Agromyces aurantiacus TaxID=165814 RepID=A0ABV9R902_9MICO|nr:hypothetical protein [Agromyces aurantiacus]MBM7505349.1 hypothetical protein [Agromyces aurantiacus]